MKKINSINYGGKVIATGLIFLLPILIALYFFNALLNPQVIQVFQMISFGIGILIEVAFLIHLAIELRQDRIINNYYCNNPSSNMTPQQILDEHKYKILWRFPLVICIIALVIGASFHGYRIHPENIGNYNIGVTMGISMASVAGISFIVFIIMYVAYKKRK